MKRSLETAGWIACLVFLGGCGDAGSARSASIAPGWERMTLKTTCGAARVEGCRGFFAFTVAKDGEFSFGPAAGSSRRVGRLAAEELRSLARSAEVVCSSDLRKGYACRPGEGSVAGGSESALLTWEGGEVFAFYARSGRALCTLGDVGGSRRLALDLAELARRYYALPYPDRRGGP